MQASNSCNSEREGAQDIFISQRKRFIHSKLLGFSLVGRSN